MSQPVTQTRVNDIYYAKVLLTRASSYKISEPCHSFNLKNHVTRIGLYIKDPSIIKTRTEVTAGLGVIIQSGHSNQELYQGIPKYKSNK